MLQLRDNGIAWKKLRFGMKITLRLELTSGNKDSNAGARRKFGPMGRTWRPEGVAVFNRWWYSPSINPKRFGLGLRSSNTSSKSIERKLR